MKSTLALAAILVLVAVPAAAAKPSGPAPIVEGAPVNPPPAWADAAGQSQWLDFSSYCWRAKGPRACLTMLPPRSRTDLNALHVHTGTLVRFHFPFTPLSLRLTVYTASGQVQYALPARRLVTWKVKATGAAELTAKATVGTARYVIWLLPPKG
jgi:hypothetical protein